MDLNGLLAELVTADQLINVDTPIRCDLELAALSRQEFKQKGTGKALLFHHLAESGLSVASNLFGSERRLLQMLRCASFAQFSEQIKKQLLQPKTPRASSVTPAKKTIQLSHTSLKVNPAETITTLPAIRSWPNEGGRYLTLALAVTRHPETEVLNVGLYRVQLISATELAINFQSSSGAGQHLQTAKLLGRKLPIALVLGSDPAYLWAAAAPLPNGCNEFEYCADIFASDNLFVDCISQELQAPADAEVIIEGQIDPGSICIEGPFGNHTGQYVTRKDCPLMRVTTVLQKPDAVIPMTVVGPPPSENIYLGKANETLIREMLKIEYSQIQDLQMPIETIFHGVTLLSIRSQGLRDNRELIELLWNNGPLSRAKVIIVFDEEIDIRSYTKCWWRTINQLSKKKIYQKGDQVAIDATGVDPKLLVVENQQIIEFLNAYNRADSCS